MKLQYVSDIHLEHRTFDKGTVPLIQPVSDNAYLALCGDIGNPFLPNYEEFLSIHAKLYEKIIIIAGNHEYFHHTLQETHDQIRILIKKYQNITYLNQESIIIGQTKFLGCTLWSDVSNIREEAQSFMNDYKKIFYNSNQLLEPENTIELHNQTKEWLKREIDHEGDVIVLTHHPATFGMLPMLDMYSPCYGSNCEDLIKKPVKYWISGHTHACLTHVVDDVTCLSNCMGYPGRESPDFNTSNYVIFE